MTHEERARGVAEKLHFTIQGRDALTKAIAAAFAEVEREALESAARLVASAVFVNIDHRADIVEKIDALKPSLTPEGQLHD